MILVCPVDNRGKVSGEPRDLPEHEAHDMIMAGRATLHRRQEAPPWLLLNEVEKALPELGRVGPPATTEALHRVSEELLPSGVRQTTMNGRHVSWSHTSSKGEVAFRKALLGPPGAVPGIMRQIGDTLSYRLVRKEELVFDERPSDDEIEALGIIEIPDPEDAEWVGDWHCFGIGSEWAKFRKECLAVSSKLNEALEKALRDGRVLIVEELFPGARLIHPDRWRDADYVPTDHPNDWFLLTRNLPEEWFDHKPEPKKPARRGRPPGSGGYEADDAPFVEQILEMLDVDNRVTVNGAVNTIVTEYEQEIKGASYEAKVRRFMDRISNARK